MKFKSNADYDNLYLEEFCPVRIELKGDKFELEGVIQEVPVTLDVILDKHAYKVIMFVEDINIAKELFEVKNSDIEIDGNRYYRSSVEQKPRAFMEIPEYEWEFTYYTYDTFD